MILENPSPRLASRVFSYLIQDMDMIVTLSVTKGVVVECGQIGVKPLCIEQTLIGIFLTPRDKISPYSMETLLLCLVKIL